MKLFVVGMDDLRLGEVCVRAGSLLIAQLILYSTGGVPHLKSQRFLQPVLCSSDVLPPKAYILSNRSLWR